MPSARRISRLAAMALLLTIVFGGATGVAIAQEGTGGPIGIEIEWSNGEVSAPQVVFEPLSFTPNQTELLTSTGYLIPFSIVFSFDQQLGGMFELQARISALVNTEHPDQTLDSTTISLNYQVKDGQGSYWITDYSPLSIVTGDGNWYTMATLDLLDGGAGMFSFVGSTNGGAIQLDLSSAENTWTVYTGAYTAVLELRIVEVEDQY